jgi:DnaK suppressor protein
LALSKPKTSEKLSAKRFDRNVTKSLHHPDTPPPFQGMTSSEKESLRAKLKDEIAGLEKQIESLTIHAQPVQPDNAIGRLTRLDEMSAKSVHYAALNTARDRLAKLKYQLATVGTPLYRPE